MDPVLVWNPNPTLDVVNEVRELNAGEVHRAERQAFFPGGKGTLVVQTLLALGVDCLGLAPVAGPTGRLVEALFEAESLPMQTSQVSGWTRAAVSIVDRRQERDTVINGPGPSPHDAEWDEHLGLVEERIRGGDFATFVVAGRPPLGRGDAGLVRLCQAAADNGLRTVLDVSSPFLEQALAADPWLVKVNLDEAEAVVGLEGDPVGQICGRGAENAVLTNGPEMIRGRLGGADFTAIPPRVRLRSAVGCGDCFLGGLLRGLRDHPDDPRESLRWAVAAAAAAAETLRPASFSLARVEELRSQALHFRLEP
jgi:6-phosphofructokinase 2